MSRVAISANLLSSSSSPPRTSLQKTLTFDLGEYIGEKNGNFRRNYQ